MSVRAKIFLITFSLLALATGGGGLFIQYQLTGYLNDDVNSNLENHAKIAQKLFIDAGLNVTNADVLADDLGEASGLRVTIISEDGTVYGDSDVLKLDLDAVENHSNRPEIMLAKNNESGLSQRFSNTLNTDMRYLAVRIPFNGENGFVRIASPLSEINRALAQVRYIVLLAVLVGFIFAIFVSYFSSNIILGYLKEFISDAEDSINDDSGNPRSSAGYGSEPYTVESAQQDLKKDLQILAKQRKQFSSVLEKMGQGVLLLNKSNEVLFYNRTIKDDFWPELEVGTKFFNNISYPALKKFLKKAWEKNELAIEINGPKSINSSYLISARRDKTKDEMLVVFNDISKLRQLEKMKEDFIGNVSHELRTPISVIRANAETLIHGKFIDDPNAIGFTEAILTQSENMTETVSELLKLSSIEAGEYDLNMENHKLGKLINQTVKAHQDQARLRNISLNVQLEEDIDIVVDASAFSIILSNFVTNALKHSPSNSEILIKNDLEDDFLTTLSVIDHGKGIPKKYRDRVFERFFRVDKGRAKHSGGTGLGLAISKHLARLMGYEVGMKPNKPNGSRFWISVNYASSEEEKSLTPELA